MPNSARRRDRLVGLFAVGMVAFNPPLLNLFHGTVFGWPVLYVYIFGVWALLIAALALVLERGREAARKDPGGPQ
jgi:hypothetical protein